jgi:TPR repeat protein
LLTTSIIESFFIAKARKYYELSAAQGKAIAQYNLGVLYECGYGVPIDKEKARHLYGLAASQGNASAQERLHKL